MTERPVVSVITPTKNRRALLCQTMDSVAAQSFEAWEHLIVDDGSDDGTGEEVQKRAATDTRVRYIKRTIDKSGANVCRNIGVRHSQAAFIVFLDSDDLLAPHCLAQRVDALQRNVDLDFAVFPGLVFVNTAQDRGQLFSPMKLGSDLDRFLYLDHPWQTSGPVWRRIAFERVGLFEEDLPSWQDVELHIRALVAGARYLKFDVPDHYIRWQDEPTKISVQQFSSADHLDKGLQIVSALHGELFKAGLLNWYRRRALGGLMFLLAERWAKNGRFLQGLRVWSAAFRLGFTPRLVHWSGAIVLILYAVKILNQQYNERLLERFRWAVGFRA